MVIRKGQIVPSHLTLNFPLIVRNGNGSIHFILTRVFISVDLS